MTTFNHIFTDDTLATINRLTNDALVSLDYECDPARSTRSRNFGLTRAIESAQNVFTYALEQVRDSWSQSEEDEWNARAWELRLELEALKYTELMASLVESTNKARAKADESWRASAKVTQ
jgi:hypothetical protein